MIINHNMSARYAQRQFSINSFKLSRTMERLSSGLRINRGLDDPAGLAVSEKMRSQIRGLTAASRNAQDGISFLQTAEGWLGETTEILQRMRELSVQMSNGIYTPEDRKQVQVEIGQLVDEIDRIAEQAEYNGMRLLKGDFASSGSPGQAAKAGDGVAIHIGANMNQRTKIFIEDMSGTALGISAGEGKPAVNYDTQDKSNESIGVIDKALSKVNTQRANLGAYQTRLEIASRGIDVAAENLQSAESRIRDTDMSLEMVKYVRDRILTEASSSLLAQANMKPFIVLKLLDNI